MKHLRLFVAAIAAVFGLSSYAQTWTGNEVTDGTFFLYNVGAQKFLNNGDPKENWGTNAYLQKGFGLDVTLAKVSEGVYTIDTQVSNGVKEGVPQQYLATSTWCDGAPTDWTFTPIEEGSKIYTISNGDSYLVANDALDDIAFGALSVTAANNQWVLVTLDDFKAAMQAKEFSTTDPMDISVFIKARSFARNDLRNSTWVTTHNGGNWVWIGASENKYFGNESWNNTFDVHQNITGLPEGTYEVQCSGFGTNGTTYIYGNTTENTLQTDNTTSYGTDKAAKWKAIHEDNAFSGNSSGKFNIIDGNLTVGVKRTQNKGGDWCVYDEFRLYFYGFDLSEFATKLAEAVTAATALDGKIPASAFEALQNVVNEKNQTYTSAADYNEATNAIKSATETAAALQAPYSRYNQIKAAVIAINADIDTTAPDATANAATSNEGIENAVLAIRKSLSEYLTNANIENEEIDLTAALIDNAEPYTNDDYWTVTDASGTPAHPNAFDAGNKCAEFWNQQGFSLKQTLTTELPKGYYKLSVIALTRDNMNGIFFAGEETEKIIGVDRSTANDRTAANNWFNGNNGVNTLTFQLEDSTPNLSIGLTADSETADYWTVWRGFSLKYLGTAPLVAFQEQLAGVVANATLDGAVPTAAQDAFDQAVQTAAAQNSTIDECLASIAAIEEAKSKYNPLVAPYAEFNTIYPQVKAVADVEEYEELTEGAHATLVGKLADFKDQIEAATTVENINTVNAGLKQAGYDYAANANPTGDAQFNLTFLLTNPDVTKFDSWAQNIDGWYTDQEDGNSQVMRNDAATSEDGTKTAFYEYWSNPAKANNAFALYQKTQLPLGTYNISCYAFAQDQYAGQNKVGVYFYANNTQGSAVTTNRLTAANIEFVNNAEQEVKIGLKTIAGNTYNWMGIGYVELYKGAAKTAVITEEGTAAENFPESNKAYATVTYEGRTLAPGYNTLVLPFNIDASELGEKVETVYAYGGSTMEGEGENAIVHLDFSQTVTSLNANTPYIVKMSESRGDLVFENKTIVVAEPIITDANFDFVGTYVALAKGNETIVAGDYISVAAGLKKSAGGNKLNAFRAFLKKKAEVPAGAKVAIMIGDEVVDGIQAAQIINNVDGTIYNLNGQKVINAQKGIFIQNGKKVVIK